MTRLKPWLYANHGKEDREVARLLGKAQIPYEDMGPSEIPTPILVYGFLEFDGIEGIKYFIKRWKNGMLPSLGV